jgi:hypothetical protein
VVFQAEVLSGALQDEFKQVVGRLKNLESTIEYLTSMMKLTEKKSSKSMIS